MQLKYLISRRHRFTVLALATIAAGFFIIFITRVFLLGAPKEPLRECVASEIFENLSFTGTRLKFHWTMETLLEERMDLYEGKMALLCGEENMDAVIPPGTFAQQVASELPYFDKRPPFVYSDFELLLTEFWRTYDCHYFALQHGGTAVARAVGIPVEEGSEQRTMLSQVLNASKQQVTRERERARRTLERLLTVLRSSEQYLPLHASLRCLQRGGADVRNAIALISDASQCLPVRLAQPETSLLK